ncbi:MAG TPA: peptidoglycan-binding domain-containing protein [Pedococcus sp.]|nr:peptidoglycan-binding domain-containing protein [Pedococcus sp.]
MIAWEADAMGTEDAGDTRTRGTGAAVEASEYGTYQWWGPGIRTLRELDAGDDVKYLQARLGLEADGYLGADTARALAAFREAHGLTAEALADREVWSLLVEPQASPAVTRRRWRLGLAVRPARAQGVR